MAKISPTANAEKQMSLKQPPPLPNLSSTCFCSFENSHFETSDLFGHSFIQSASFVPCKKKKFLFNCVCSMLLSIASAPCSFQLLLLLLF